MLMIIMLHRHSSVVIQSVYMQQLLNGQLTELPTALLTRRLFYQASQYHKHLYRHGG